MPTTLRSRLAAATALLGAVVSALLLAILPSRLDALSRRWMESRALGIAELVARSVGPALDFDDAAAAKAAIAPLGDEAGYALVALRDGHRLAASGSPPVDPLAPTDAPVVAYAPDLLRVALPVTTRGGTRGVIELGFRLRELEERRREARSLVLALSLLLLAGGLAAAWVLGTTLARPFDRVTEVARRVASGDEAAGRDLPTGESGEAGELARAFARMLERLLEQSRTIREMNDQLAARVDERTRELARTSDALAELKRTQEQLVLADREVTVGRLAAGVGHEINNPLSFVVANLQWLGNELRRHRAGALSEVGAPSPTPEALDEMEVVVRQSLDGADRVRRIVSQLRNFSRGNDEDRRGPMQVAEATEVAIEIARHETRHRARIVRLYGGAPPVSANPVQLAQVFLNLIVNAAHSIRAGAPEENEIRVSVSTDPRGWAAVGVQDTGAGIRPDVLPRIFEPFFTTKPRGEGSGLGLSISRDIVRGLGGEIAVESEPGKGSTFTVRLPPTSEPVVAAPAEWATATAPAAESLRLLLVDDEPMVLAAMARLLKSWGDVETAGSGKEALERLRAGARFDLIVCDVMMPEMSGIELYRKVAVELPQQAMCFVFLTGGAADTDARNFLDTWGGPYLFKPLNLEKLRRIVDERHR